MKFSIFLFDYFYNFAYFPAQPQTCHFLFSFLLSAYKVFDHKVSSRLILCLLNFSLDVEFLVP